MGTSAHCVCGGNFSTKNLDLGFMPISSILDNKDKIPLRYYRCNKCSISSAIPLADANLLYGDDYNFFSGASAEYVEYAGKLANFLNTRIDLNGKRILEIACNDGTLSAELLKYGCQLTGVEPFSQALNKFSHHPNALLINDFFSLKLVKERQLENAFDMVIVSNVISHVVDFFDFMHALSKVVKKGGFIYAENLDYNKVITDKRFENFYHGVCNLLSPTTFNRILRNNFDCIEALGAGFDPNSKAFILEKKANSHDLVWSGNDGVLLEQCDLIDWKQNLDAWVNERIGSAKCIGYGANSKAGIFLTLSQSLRARISVVLDINKQKSGRYLAGTDVLISDVETFDFNGIEKIVLFAPHLIFEVREMLNSLGFKGELCVFNATS